MVYSCHSPATAAWDTVSLRVCSAKNQLHFSLRGRQHSLGAVQKKQQLRCAAAAAKACRGSTDMITCLGIGDQGQHACNRSECLGAVCFGSSTYMHVLTWFIDISSSVPVCFFLQNLAKDPEARRWFVQAELVHCRTAMVGAAGILLPAVSRTAWAGQGHQHSQHGRTVTPQARGLHSSSRGHLGVSQCGRQSIQLGAPVRAGMQRQQQL